MHIEEKLVFFDLETAGVDPRQHPIIQIAAIGGPDQVAAKSAVKSAFEIPYFTHTS